MIKFELVTLAGVKFSENVHEVMLPTPQGEIAVFEHHMPLVSLVSPGIIKVRPKSDTKDNHLEYFSVHGGVIEIADNTVRVLVDEAVRDSELNEKEVQAALHRAIRLRAEAKEQVDLDKAQALIDRHNIELKVADLRRRKKG
jgi:F-type H+-transporting ATPase subunit epsilon